MYLKEDDERVPACAPKEELADTLSGLLRQAVRDCQLVEKMPDYTVDMGNWHDPDADTCRVCMAGAVMTCTLGASRDERNSDIRKRFPDADRKFEAINMMRGSLFRGAYKELYGEFPATDLSNKLIAISDVFRGHWISLKFRFPWEMYEDAAAKLEALGL